MTRLSGMQLRCWRRRRLDREESYFAYGAGIDFSKMMKTCTCRGTTVAVLIRIGRQPSADCAASAVSIAGAASLMIWYSCVLSVYVSHPKHGEAIGRRIFIPTGFRNC